MTSNIEQANQNWSPSARAKQTLKYVYMLFIYITVYTFMSVLNTVLQNFRDKNEVKTLDQQCA